MTDSRAGDGYIRRRRECKVCVPPIRFTTVELMVEGSARVNLAHMAEPVLRSMQMQAKLEAMSPERRKRVLAMIDDLSILTNLGI